MEMSQQGIRRGGSKMERSQHMEMRLQDGEESAYGNEAARCGGYGMVEFESKVEEPSSKTYH
jgi:hypothetical protein